MIRFLGVASFVAGLLSFPGIGRAHSVPGGDSGGAAARQSAVDTTFSVERDIVLDVNLASSKVIVRGWNRSAVEVREEGRSSALDITHSARVVRVESRFGGRSGGRESIEIRVPRGTRVSVSSRQGDVQVIDVGGSVDLSVISGNVTVQGASERTTVSVASGSVTISDADGPVHVDALSGAISMDDIRGDVQVSGTSNIVRLNRIRASHVEAEVVSGTISFDGSLAEGGRYQFTTYTGAVHLSLADNAKGTLEVQSFNGQLHAEIPVTLLSGGQRVASSRLRSSENRSGTSLGGRLQRFEFGGGGSAEVVVSTFTGGIHIDRGVRR